VVPGVYKVHIQGQAVHDLLDLEDKNSPKRRELTRPTTELHSAAVRIGISYNTSCSCSESLRNFLLLVGSRVGVHGGRFSQHRGTNFFYFILVALAKFQPLGS
jgi:hypothetical protein